MASLSHLNEHNKKELVFYLPSIKAYKTMILKDEDNWKYTRTIGYFY